MGRTKIRWATYTTNIVHGCSKPPAFPQEVLDRMLTHDDELGSAIWAVAPQPFEKWLQDNTSPECFRCYAETLSNRRQWTPLPWLMENERENVQLHPERFKEFGRVKVQPVSLPPSLRERFFVCSMGDLFHRLVPDAFLSEFWNYILPRQHIIMLLTKRPERAFDFEPDLYHNGEAWPDHIWLGTSVGHSATKWRIEYLRRSKAKVRFLSVEPLLESMLPIDLTGIDQLIVGGETNAGYRRMNMQWALELRDEAVRQGCAFYFKQDSHIYTEARPYLVEPDGSCWTWQQFPGELTPPEQVFPKFRIL